MNKFTKWLKTRTGQSVVAGITGATAIYSPVLSEQANQVLSSVSSGDSFAAGVALMGIIAGIARTRSLK
jgi:hypothetical protein